METIIYLFIAFLFINIVVGLYYSRGVNSFRTYAVGNGRMPTWLLAATIISTWATGSGFEVFLSFGFKHGAYGILYPLLVILPLIFLGALSLRMGEFYGTVSIAGIMRRLYGNRVACFTAAAGFICCIGFLAAQLRIFSGTVANVLGLDPTIIMLTLSTLVFLYSILGGIRSVVFTDLLQFAIMGMSLPIVVYLLYGYLGEKSSMISYVPEGKPFLISTFLEKIPDQLPHHMLTLLIGFRPTLLQRCLMNRDLLQTRKAFRRAAVGYAYIIMLITLLSRMLVADAVGLNHDSLFESAVAKYGFLGFRTLLSFVLMAMAFSSVDSYINTSAILLGELSNKKSLSSTRWFGIPIGLFGVTLALFAGGNVLHYIYMVVLLYLPGVVPPFLLALFGFRSSPRTALMSMVGGTVVACACKIIFMAPTATCLGALVNVLLMFGLHYGLGEPGGWVGIKDSAPLIAHAQLRQRRWASFWASIRDFDLFRYMRHNLPQKEGHYIFFGFYVLTFIFGGIFFLPRHFLQDERLVWVLGSFLVLNSITMTYPIWPKEVKCRWLIAPFWSLNVGYSLFYIGMFWLLLGEFQWVHVVLFVVNLVLGVLLFRRKLMLFWFILGGLMAVLTHRVMGYPIVFNVSLQHGFAIAVVLAGLCALYANQQKKRSLVRKYLTLGSLQRSTEDALTALRLAPDHFAKQLVETNHAGVDAAYQMSKARLGETDELTRQISASACYLAKTIQLIQTQTRLEQQVYPLSKFLHRFYDRYSDLDDGGLILYNQSRTAKVKWDIHKIHQLLYKTYHYVKRYHPEVPYSYLYVRDTRLQYPGHPKSVAAVAFFFALHSQHPRIATSYTHTERLEDPFFMGNGYLRELHTLIDKHYGHLDLSQSPPSALVVLPLRLDKICPQLIEDQKAPHKALRGDVLREARFTEGDFWVWITQQAHYDISEIEQVVHFMKAAHQHQARKGSTPYYVHPLRVAKYVSEYNLEPHLLTAALLHDIVEGTPVTLEEIDIRFGHRVAQLVKLLSNTDLDTFKKYKVVGNRVHAAWLAQNRDVILIKACDRVHNLENLHVMPPAKQQAKARETLDHYVPVVQQAGFPDLAHRLTEMAKRFL